MKGFRRSLALLLVPLLIALLAAPTAAAPEKEKTNQDHPSWLVLDPLPETTGASTLTISGSVAGRFDMEIRNGAFVKQFEAKGKFSVSINLTLGQNQIMISGIDSANRKLNHVATVQATFTGDNPGNGGSPGDGGNTGGGGNSGGGEDSGGPGNDSCEGNIYSGRQYNPDGQAVQFNVEFGCGNLVANGTSEFSLIVVAVDENGYVTPGYQSAITASSSNPDAVSILTPVVTPVNGIGVILLRGGTLVAPAVITIASDLGVTTLTLTPQAP